MTERIVSGIYTRLLSSDGIFPRSIIFILAVGAIVIVCVVHGLSDRNRTAHLVNAMSEKGRLTGKFWRIVKCQKGRITATKYQRTITLAYSPPKDTQIGDRISFIAKLPNANGQSAPLWQPDKIHFHGTSTFRYLISVLSVLLVLVMCLRYLRFDKKSFSLILRNR